MPNPAFLNHGLLKRALAVWLILIAVEFVHGILRAIFLVPVVGDFRARQIGVFIGSALILLVAYLFIGWLRCADDHASSNGVLDCLGEPDRMDSAHPGYTDA